LNEFLDSAQRTEFDTYPGTPAIEIIEELLILDRAGRVLRLCANILNNFSDSPAFHKMNPDPEAAPKRPPSPCTI
jgi:hypothetical protein